MALVHQSFEQLLQVTYLCWEVLQQKCGFVTFENQDADRIVERGRCGQDRRKRQTTWSSNRENWALVQMSGSRCYQDHVIQAFHQGQCCSQMAPHILNKMAWPFFSHQRAVTVPSTAASVYSHSDGAPSCGCSAYLFK